MNEEERRRKDRAERLARKHRWEYPGKVRVVHPKYGEVIVPGASPYAAILCAAEKWKCDSTEIMDAKVLAVDNPSVSFADSSPCRGAVKKDKKEQPTLAGADCNGEKF